MRRLDFSEYEAALAVAALLSAEEDCERLAATVVRTRDDGRVYPATAQEQRDAARKAKHFGALARRIEKTQQT